MVYCLEENNFEQYGTVKTFRFVEVDDNNSNLEGEDVTKLAGKSVAGTSHHYG